jgi:hypothetical protein
MQWKYNQPIGWNEIEIEVVVTQGKKGKAKTTKWNPYEKAIG